MAIQGTQAINHSDNSNCFLKSIIRTASEKRIILTCIKLNSNLPGGLIHTVFIQFKYMTYFH